MANSNVMTLSGVSKDAFQVTDALCLVMLNLTITTTQTRANTLGTFCIKINNKQVTSLYGVFTGKNNNVFTDFWISATVAYYFLNLYQWEKGKTLRVWGSVLATIPT